MFKTYLICCGLGYLASLIVAATALIQAAIIRAAARNSLPQYLALAFKLANGLSTLGAFLAWGALVGPFLRSGGDTYRYPLAITLLVGLGVTFFAIRELDGLRQSK